MTPPSTALPDLRAAWAQPKPARPALLERLAAPRPLVAVELRPPRADLTPARSIESWIDMHHALRRVVKQDTFVFLTDNAVGRSEEESLQHLSANLSREVSTERLVPFLTSKHSLDYCLMFADRASSSGYQALTVLGGDRDVGAPRCLPHASGLRARIRQRVPGLSLGGWANPHRDPTEQAGYLESKSFTGEFFLTQVVSHHDLHAVERFLTEVRRRELPTPGVLGVFFYRSARPQTLRTLSKFLPVPLQGITRDFEQGLSPDEVCAKTIRALRDLGADKVYVSNLEFDQAAQRLRRIVELVG